MKLKRIIAASLLGLKAIVGGVGAIDTPLHDAVFWGKIDAVRAFCKTNASWLEEKNQQGLCPLHLAVATKKFEIFKCLVEECGGNVDQRDYRERTPLHWISYHGKLPLVRYLVEECGADVNARDCSGRTPFLLALGQAQLDVAQYLAVHGADVTVCDKDKCGAIFYGIYSGNTEVLRYLIEESDVPTNMVSKSFLNPLHVAAKHGNIFVAEYLLSGGKEIPAVIDRSCATALGEIPYGDDLMCDEGKLGMRSIWCADLNMDGQIPEERRTEDQKRCEVMTAVFKQMLHESNVFLQTPLHYAIKYRQPAMAECLIQYGADVNDQDVCGRTPLFYAVITKQINLVKYLVEHGAKVDLKDRNGKTPLHYATEKQYFDVALYLVEDGGASFEVPDNTGKSPWNIAQEQGSFVFSDYYAMKSHEKYSSDLSPVFDSEHNFEPEQTGNSECNC